MRTLEELDLVPAWVNPGHLVATAVHVMQGHKINAVAVLEGADLSGLVTLERALAMPRFARVETIVQPLPTRMDCETSVRDAAEAFIERDVNYAAVYREDEFRGLLTATMLLREVGQSWDPLTALPWSNRLRSWGMAELEAGGEITLVFVDIDDFGAYNKRHGHIVGDKILKQLAAALKERIDHHTEVLVRFGGDEFVIGTRLDRYAAERRFGEVEDLRLNLEEVPEPVTVSVGFAGGMRSIEREHAHVASMLDNLINLASQECTRKKQEKAALSRQPEAQPSAPEPAQTVVEEPVQEAPAAVGESIVPRDFEVRLVSVDENDPNAPVAVTLRIDGTDGTAAAMPNGRSLMDTVADAASRALERIDPGSRVRVTATVVDSAPDGEKVVTIVGTCESGGATRAITATRRVNRDVYRAVAEAVAAGYCGLPRP